MPVIDKQSQLWLHPKNLGFRESSRHDPCHTLMGIRPENTGLKKLNIATLAVPTIIEESNE